MKSERKHFYALRKHAPPKTLATSITADSPENLGISNQRFDACDRAAYALACPAIDSDKKILVLTTLEFEQLFDCFTNGDADGDFAHAYCQTAATKAAFVRVQRKMRELRQKKN